MEDLSNITVQKGKIYYLFFDTETTGVPKNYKAPMSNLKNWPRLVQIAWIACDENGNTIESDEYIIKPNGFIIPNDATLIHGITTEKAIQEGKDINDVLTPFAKLAGDAAFLVGHNVSFDMNIVGAEMIRANMACVVENKKFICTMKSSVDFCAIPGYYGNKWPKLEELYAKLFRKRLQNAHTAMTDINATKECFFELKKRNII
jgi:DNA polymerase III epsilon subunit-like protein